MPLKLVMGKEIVGDYSRLYAAPPCGCFDVFLAGAEVGVDADCDLEVKDSQEARAELVVKVEAAAAAGCPCRYLKTLVLNELRPPLRLLSLEGGP